MDFKEKDNHDSLFRGSHKVCKQRLGAETAQQLGMHTGDERFNQQQNLPFLQQTRFFSSSFFFRVLLKFTGERERKICNETLNFKAEMKRAGGARATF